MPRTLRLIVTVQSLVRIARGPSCRCRRPSRVKDRVVDLDGERLSGNSSKDVIVKLVTYPRSELRLPGDPEGPHALLVQTSQGRFHWLT
jgi:hypothetical protein